MVNWITMRLFCITVPLLSGLTPTQASPNANTQASPKIGSPASFAAPVTFAPEEIASTSQSLALVKQGNASVQRLAWQNAKQEYQAALDLWPGNLDALYGLAKCSHTAGDQAKAIAYYRQAVYSANSADKGFRETNTNKLMDFAILLNKAGQATEAVFVYNHSAYALDYQDSQFNGGKPYLKVLLPKLAAEPASSEQVQYTPERLQALADTALAHEEMSFGSNAEAITHMKEAAKLYPDSAAIQYYLGEALFGSYYVYLDSAAKDKAAAWAAYQEDKKATDVAYKKAAELGDDKTVAAAKERLAAPR